MRALYDTMFSFNRPLCIDYIAFISGMIVTLPYCTRTMFVDGTTEVMRWSLAPVSDLCLCHVGVVSKREGILWYLLLVNFMGLI